MAYPKNFAEMKAQNYKFDNDAECRGCGDAIEWWITPNGKKMPMNPMTCSESPAVPHWSTCSDAPSFRK
jgi:hypothetical protein